ncbi:hypothetical protein JHK82_018583 [Glycine max]|nr:hypothetical protein JHK82_018583 [Glycine max]
MSRKSKRVCLSPDVNDKPTPFLKYNGGGGNDKDNRVSRNGKRVTRPCTFRFSMDTNLSPAKFLLQLGEKVASAIRNVSVRRRSSRKVSSSTLVRSRSLSDLTDSHRAETFSKAASCMRIQMCVLGAKGYGAVIPKPHEKEYKRIDPTIASL